MGRFLRDTWEVLVLGAMANEGYLQMLSALELALEYEAWVTRQQPHNRPRYSVLDLEIFVQKLSRLSEPGWVAPESIVPRALTQSLLELDCFSPARGPIKCHTERSGRFR